MNFGEGRRRILSIDCGSSSLKAAVYDCGAEGERRLLEAAVERIGEAAGTLHVNDYRDSEPRVVQKALRNATAVAALLALLAEFE
ncbi:MAG: hypothetical protein IAI50_07195, partial [Candidatus Eremiobacteraeota bacterium]|nr:hypothetical protein [Candidatus Eremiobacteraeota bacterium]